MGGGCATANAGDVVVQYDKLADRWILTQLSSLSSPYGECIAVSTTGDPTGTYNAYYYTFGTTLPDYPKFGVWPTDDQFARIWLPITSSPTERLSPASRYVLMTGPRCSRRCQSRPDLLHH